MAQIIWTEPALFDLEELAQYIALDDINAAKNLVRKIFNTVSRLEEFPNSGRKPPELERTSRYLEVIENPCRIFYRIDNNQVYILYVMRSGRELRKFLIDERSGDISQS